MSTLLTSAPALLDRYDNALIRHLKRCSGAKVPLNDILALYAWRVEMNPDYVAHHLPSVADYLYQLCERLHLLGASFASPVAFGGLGVMRDAAPDREWALLLDVGATGPLADSSTRVYWRRIVSVLCSRLMMAKVADLPGYDHEAEAEDGPFRYLPDGTVLVEGLEVAT